MNETTREAEFVLKLISQTDRNIFLTGKAGTGKTTLLREIVRQTHKNCVIVAPTGIAAINAGGVTIHSMFQLPFNAFLPIDDYEYNSNGIHFETKKTINRHFKIRSDKRNLINNIELLIVDEVSMLRPDVLDAMNAMLQSIRFNREPFGGAQVLFIGDLQQLPPIVKQDEWEVMNRYYEGKFFFHSQVLKHETPIYIELSKIFRQTDQEFIQILNQVRNNEINEDLIDRLNYYVDRDFEIKSSPGYIVLTTHNNQADNINRDALVHLKPKECTYSAKIVDDFPPHLYPLDKDLKLKEGAQVMFIKNDLNFEKRYFNGKIGIISSLDSDRIEVEFPEENKTIIVDENEWENKRYKLNPLTNEIEEEVLGTYTQYPLKLAWAITIHKSQGLTFQKAAIDISNIFAPGQAYVALSRLTSLKGLKLLAPISNRRLETESDIIAYEDNKEQLDKLESDIQHYTSEYLFKLMSKTYDFTYIIRQINRLQKRIYDDGDKAKSKLLADWVEKFSQQIFALQDISKKFQSSLQRIFSGQLDMNYIIERNEKAHDYFYDRLVMLEKEVLIQISEIAVIKGTKEIENNLHEIENGLFMTLKQVVKSKKIILHISQNVPLTKENCDTREIEKIKQNIVSEIIAAKKTDISHLLQPSERGLAKNKKEKTTTPKIPTHEQSYTLWKEGKSLEEISQIRKFTYGTIVGHLSKYLASGEVQVTDLIEIKTLKKIDAILSDKYQSKSLTDLHTETKKAHSFEELRLYLTWKELQK